MPRMSSTSAAEVIITVPGLYTCPSGYFCVIERLSLPVGIFIPSASAKSLAAFTASYNLASSPGLRHGHIQLAERDTLLRPSANGAHTMFVNASATDSTDPADALIMPAAGAWPRAVAIPLLPR